ncbi:hypothetical protein KJ765_05515 [Candidatus Micrarchaeota archaeon]|nr:hypothetical protein [Candidatus Micrarchaeota archaeon]
MKKVVSSAPSKLILVGEHAVVYGARALACPLNNRKECTATIETVEPGEGQLIVEDVIGCGRVTVDGVVFEEDPYFMPKAKLILHFLKKNKNRLNDKEAFFKFSSKRILKGTGGSAASAAALSLALHALLDIQPSLEELFRSVQVAEEIAHGGKASGIDAHTVLSDRPQAFFKQFKGSTSSIRFEDADLHLPEGTQLVIINTLEEGEEPESTGELVKRFAAHFHVDGSPNDLSDDTRQTIIAPFDRVTEAIQKELRRDGEAKALGRLLDENHELLRSTGVSGDRIEEAIALCKKNKALGAKLTGAGGRGGACFALVRNQDTETLVHALEEKRFEVSPAEFSSKGPTVERR